MKVIVRENYEALCETAAHILLGEMCQDRRVNVALTDGRSPQGVYDRITPFIRKKGDEFKNVHFYTYDETKAPPGQEGMCIQMFREQIFEPAAIAKESIHQLTYDNAETFIEELFVDGGLDLMMLGLGKDGHFCANLVGTTRFSEEIYRFKVLEFGGMPDIKDMVLPDMVTFGLKSVLKAKKLLVIANGIEKAEIVKKIFDAPISEALPATGLRLHPNAVFIFDKEAASLSNFG